VTDPIVLEVLVWYSGQTALKSLKLPPIFLYLKEYIRTSKRYVTSGRACRGARQLSTPRSPYCDCSLERVIRVLILGAKPVWKCRSRRLVLCGWYGQLVKTHVWMVWIFSTYCDTNMFALKAGKWGYAWLMNSITLKVGVMALHNILNFCGQAVMSCWKMDTTVRNRLRRFCLPKLLSELYSSWGFLLRLHIAVANLN